MRSCCCTPSPCRVSQSQPQLSHPPGGTPGARTCGASRPSGEARRGRLSSAVPSAPPSAVAAAPVGFGRLVVTAACCDGILSAKRCRWWRCVCFWPTRDGSVWAAEVACKHCLIRGILGGGGGREGRGRRWWQRTRHLGGCLQKLGAPPPPPPSHGTSRRGGGGIWAAVRLGWSRGALPVCKGGQAARLASGGGLRGCAAPRPSPVLLGARAPRTPCACGAGDLGGACAGGHVGGRGSARGGGPRGGRPGEGVRTSSGATGGAACPCPPSFDPLSAWRRSGWPHTKARADAT